MTSTSTNWSRCSPTSTSTASWPRPPPTSRTRRSGERPRPAWRRDVAGFVTLGSPLGGARILSLLEPGPVAGRGRFPGGTSRWVNIRNADDPACVRSLPEAFEGPVSERLVDNGHRVHDPEPYLNNPTTGGAIAGMLTSGT